MALKPGDKFGRYEIEELLGEGGMGTVYRAFDTTLQRRVALKLVREEEGAPAGARANERLLREARAAAGIDHINAIAIHDVGEIGGVPYIAMELVLGRWLRAYVGDASVDVETRVRWLVDVARALDAAHVRGLVHRDVKPENVMVREDGVVKVVDFGIASYGGGPGERAETGAPGPGVRADSWGTSISGKIPGTPRYMSPEQILGEPLDARADQFAWGVMAYELLAGTAPLELGAMTLSAVVHLQEKDPVPLRDVATNVPVAVARVIHRALRKDPSDRFPSMSVVVAELDAARTSLRAAGPRRWTLAVAAAVGTACVVTWVATRPQRPLLAPAPPASAATTPVASFAFRPTHPRRITFEDGCEEFPVFTPDGRSVVFDATRGHDSVLVVRSLADGAERTLTDVRGWDTGADVSPDGTQIVFQRYTGGETGSWIMGMDGAAPPRRLASGAVKPTFTPDGSAVWCGDGEHLVRIDVASGQQTRELRSPSGGIQPHIRELADGRVIVLFSGDRGSVTGVVAYALDGALRWISPDPFADASAHPLWRDTLEEVLAITPDGSNGVVSRDTEAGNVELYAIPLGGGEPTRIADTDVTARSGLRFAKDGRAVVWSTCHPEQSPARVDSAGKLEQLRETQPWLEAAFAPVPRSRRSVVLSQRDGTMAPWVVEQDSRVPPRKLEVPGRPTGVAVSPDGSLVAFELAGIGIVVVPIDGGPVRSLTSNAGDGKPSFRKDGRSLLFTRQTEGAPPRVFAVDLGEGEPRPALEPATSDGAASPVDERVAYLAGSNRARYTPSLFDSRTGAHRRLADGLPVGAYRAVVFSPDGRRVSVLLGASQVFEVDVVSGAILRSVDSLTDSFAGLSYLGDDPVVIRVRWIGDAWLADGPF